MQDTQINQKLKNNIDNSVQEQLNFSQHKALEATSKYKEDAKES